MQLLAEIINSIYYSDIQILIPFIVHYFIIFFGLCLISSLVYLTLKYNIIPWAIQKAVRDLPLDKDLLFKKLHIIDFLPEGNIASLHLQIMHSKPLLSCIRITVSPTSPLIIFHALSNRPILQVNASDPVVVTGLSDVEIKQDRVELRILELLLLKEMIRKIFVGGEKELDSLSIKIQLQASFNFWNGFMTIEDLPLEKIINFGIVRQQKTDARAKRMKTMKPNSQDIADYGIHSLLPNPNFKTLPFSTTIKSIIGGFSINFSSLPAMCLSIPVIRFTATLNGSCVASGKILGFIIDPKKKNVELVIEVVPSIVSKPIRGFASAAKGMIRGALTGTLNGLLFGEWGAGSTILGIENIEILDIHGSRVLWIETLLDALDIEKDLDAVRKVTDKAGQTVSSMKEGITNLTAGIVDAAISKGSKCIVM